MKKSLFFVVMILLFITAFSLFGCGIFDKKTDTPPKVDEDYTWQTIESPTPTDVYSRLLSGFMNVATDFSKKSLASSPILGADAKLKITMSDLVLWVSFKANYDNNAKNNTMFAFELSTKEDSYDDVVIGIYMCPEMQQGKTESIPVIYVTLGTTRFKFNMPVSQWDNIFPIDMALDNSKAINNVAGFMYMVLAVKDDKINGKTRLNGLIEEYNYNFSLDLAGTLSKVQGYLAKNEDDTELITKINNIFANVLGLSVENITKGNVPESELDIDFTIANTKLSALNLNIQIDQSGEYANTLFKGEDINLDIELLKFSTSKAKIPIEFINSTEKRKAFVDYLSGDYTFKLTLDIEKIINLETKATKDYTVEISAKVFQEDSMTNFMLIEFYEKSSNALEKALYVYNNEFYTFDTIENNLVCTTKMPLDLSALAEAVVNNTFGDNPKTGQFNLFDTISYVLGVLKMDSNGFLFNINNKVFSNIWFNYEQMLTYVDSLMVEDIFSTEYKLKDFESFITDYDTIANFVFDTEFLSMILNDDAIITAAISRMQNAVPLNEFTPITSSEGE